MRIIVLDDEERVRNILKNMLSEMGHSVCTVERGSYALNLLKMKNFDVILLDILMDEINGVDVMKKLKEMGNNIRIVVITCVDDEGIQKYVKNMGIEQYIIKPYNINSLKDTLEKPLLSLKS